MADATVASLHVYPVKSLAGICVPHAAVEARGLQYDRRWMVVDGDGLFLTQREHPRMALCAATPTPDALWLRAPGMDALRVPRCPAGVAPISVRVWRTVCDALPVDDAGDRWLSRYLGVPCRLVYMPDSTRRAVNPDYAAGEGIVSFADGYPLLVLSEASLGALNARLSVPLAMDRFRPNVVVRGVPAYDEDTWGQVRIGSLLFHGVKPCERCAITGIDQQTAARGVEPLRTLAEYRKFDGKIFFGRYLIPEAPGALRVGDGVEVVLRREPYGP